MDKGLLILLKDMLTDLGTTLKGSVGDGGVSLEPITDTATEPPDTRSGVAPDTKTGSPTKPRKNEAYGQKQTPSRRGTPNFEAHNQVRQDAAYMDTHSGAAHESEPS